MEPAERGWVGQMEQRNEMWRDMHKAGILGEGARLPAPVRDAWNLQGQRWALYTQASHEHPGLTGKPLQLLRLAEDARLLIKIGVWSQEQATNALRLAQAKTAEDLSYWRSQLSGQFFGGQVLSDTRRALSEAKDGTLTVIGS
jgi:hypothetical protein